MAARIVGGLGVLGVGGYAAYTMLSGEDHPSTFFLHGPSGVETQGVGERLVGRWMNIGGALPRWVSVGR
jgi:hypothetical protein